MVATEGSQCVKSSYKILVSFLGPPESVPPKPSETFDGHWIQATDRTGSHRIGGGVGKWMIFPQASELDSQWEKIRIATENGQLGFAAKVSTALHIQGKSQVTTIELTELKLFFIKWNLCNANSRNSHAYKA